MNATASPSLPSEHPSPHRSRVSGAAIAIGLCAAPLAWSLQLLLNVSSASHACFPKDVPLLTPEWPSLHLVVLVIDLVALAVCLVAGLVAWRSWLKTNHEKPGSGHHVLESGDGRTRFMAMAGMMTSGLFFVAIAFAALNLAALTACGR